MSANSNQTRWEALRHLLHEPPASTGWRSLLELLEGWDSGDRALALEYAEAHLESWPAELRVVSDGEGPLVWALARHLKLDAPVGEPVQPMSTGCRDALAASPGRLQILTIACRADLEVVCAMKPMPLVSELHLKDLYGDVDGIGEDDLTCLAEVLPNLRALSVFNCLAIAGLDVRHFANVEHLRVVAVEMESWTLRLPTQLRDLELSALEISLTNLLSDLKLPALENLTLGNLQIEPEALEIMNDFPALSRVEVIQCGASDETTNVLVESGLLAREARCANALSRTEPLPSSSSCSPQLTTHIGVYEASSTGPCGGESARFELWQTSDGRLQFTYRWTGYWVSDMAADSDSHELEGGVYPLSSDHLLLVATVTNSHRYDLDGPLPYVWFSGQSTCILTDPLGCPNLDYSGPFGMTLRRVEQEPAQPG